MAETLQTFLQMQRDGVVDLAADLVCLQMADEFVASARRHADDILIEDVAAVGIDDGGLQELAQMVFFNEGVVALRGGLAGCGPFVEVRELDSQGAAWTASRRAFHPMYLW